MTVVANKGVVKDVAYRRPNSWVLRQKLVDQICCFAAEFFRYDELAAFDSHKGILDCRTLKRRFTGHHCVHDASETPQVGLEPIRFILYNFR